MTEPTAAGTVGEAVSAGQSVWAPLRVRAFRVLWFVQLGSMLGTWMQTVGAQWLLVDAPDAETLVAMVQVAAMVPTLLLALPAGALADIMDRVVGPALAGLVIAQVGAGAVFAINAVTAVAFALVLTASRRPGGGPAVRPERFASAMRTGQRYVRNSPVVRRMLLRVALFVLPGGAMWALLPLVASRLLRAGAAGYGLLLGALGAGAVLGADLLPRLSSRLSPNGLMLVSGLGYAA